MTPEVAGEAWDSCVEAALYYAERGWRVVPVHGIADGMCTCGNPDCPSPGKHPRTRHGVGDATCEPRLIREFWCKWPDANVAVAPDRDALILDVDGQLGKASIGNRPIPATPTTRTGNGYHFYFRAPSGFLAGNRTALLDHVDLRATGGYAVAPPSLHVTGRRYEWADYLSPTDIDPVPPPDWLVALLHRDAATHTRAKADPDADTIPEGTRNASLTSFAGRLRNVGSEYGEIVDALIVRNRDRCKPPLPEGEVRRIARSVSGYPTGPVRVDDRIVNADVSDGAKLLAALLAAGVTVGNAQHCAGVSERTIRRWSDELCEANLEQIAHNRPQRRYTIVPRSLLQDPEVNTEAKITGLMMASRMQEGKSTIGQEKLAELRGYASRSKISGHLRSLEQLGYLEVKRATYCPAEQRRKRVNRYRWPEAELR